jgi:bifunctional non-homologous end joining protein LigD
MYARAVQQLPEGKDWLYEVKFDGYRCLAGTDSTSVTLWSRRGNRFTEQFPTVAEACEHLPPDTLLDAEKEMVNSGLVSSEERTAVRIRWSLGYVAGCRW